MVDWIVKLDNFTRISDRQILAHAGTVSHEIAKLKAESELERFRAAQDALPRTVDQHFAAAVEELTQINGRAKKPMPGRRKKARDQ